MIRSLLVFVITVSAVAGDAVRPPAPPDEPPAAFTPKGDFSALKKAYKTKLRRPDKAPEDYNPFLAPGVKVIPYKSGELLLRAWYRVPAAAEAGKKIPAVIFFHGGFAFHKDDLEAAQPFVDAGYAVLIPTLRAENGNPGNFELFYGEADDAVAAVKWLALQPEIDAGKIYTFGHGSGGALSSLLSLYPDIPVRLTGSSSGIFTELLFESLARENLSMVPFDVKNEQEVRLRLLAKNVPLMQRGHAAIIGKQDQAVMKQARDVQKIAQAEKAPLTFSVVDGDSETSREPAIQLFLRLIRKDLDAEAGKGQP